MDKTVLKIKENLNINNISDYMKNIAKGSKKNKKNNKSNNKSIFNYDIQKSIKTDFHNINTENIKQVNICAFRFIETTKYNNISNPLLQYALFKYPESSSKTSNLCVFPFEPIKNTSVKETGKKIVKKIFNKQYNCLGYIKDDKDIFLFYNIDYSVEVIVKKSNKIIWCLIDEICNHKCVFNFPIHNSVTNLFLKNENLIYLKDSKKNNISVPNVYYIGREYSVLPFIYTIGMKASANKIFGPYYYFTNYLGSFRNAAWTTNYKRRRLNNKILTDKMGLHNEGGIIRFAVFTDNSRVITNKINDKYNFEEQIKMWESGDTSSVGQWSKTYSNLFVPTLKDEKTDNIINSHSMLVVKNYSDIVPLTIQKIDKSSLPPIWNPNYTKYAIL